MPFFSKKIEKEKDSFEWTSEIMTAVFDAFSYPVVMTTAEGNIVYANSAMWRSLGYEEKEKTQTNLNDAYFDAEERERLFEIIKRNGEAAHYRVHFKKKNGDASEAFLNARSIRSDGKSFILISMIGTSDLQNARKELETKDEEIESYYKNSSDAIMRLTPPLWKFTIGNPATFKMFGVKNDEEFTKLGPWDLSPEFQPDGQPSSVKAKAMIEKAMREGSNFFEWTHKKYNNNQNFSATVFLTRLGSGNNIYLQAIVRDISIQKNEEYSLRNFIELMRERLGPFIPSVEKISAEQFEKDPDRFVHLLSALEKITNDLQERNIFMENSRKSMISLAEDLALEKDQSENAKNEIEAIISGIGDGVFVVNNQGKVTLFNPAAQKISGFDPSDILGKKYGDTLQFFSHEYDEVPSDFIFEMIATGTSKALGTESVLKTKKGELVPVAGGVSPLKSKEGKPIGGVVVFSDVSREREIDKAKSEFVSLASHQLRTPISTVSWFLEMLLSGEVGEMNPKQKEYLQEVDASNRRMKDLVSMLLNVSRIEMGTFIVNPVPTEMKKVIEKSLLLVHPLSDKKHITVETGIEKELPNIDADQNLLSIVIDNLLANAVSYTKEGGHIFVGATKNEKNIILEVTDDGIGIPKEAQPKIFSKIFRADNAKEIDTDGTGIGLFMTKSIIESWNGDIHFLSPPQGKDFGTSFFVTIPLSGMIKKEGTVQLIQA